MTTVVAVWRHPVKSMVGHTVERAHLARRGLDGDRRWAVTDAHTGVALSAKRHATLLRCTARLVGAEVEVTLPDGQRVGSHEPGSAARALSDLLGREVVLTAAGPHRSELEWTADEVAEGLRGTFVDAAPAHLVSVSEAAAFDADVARLRPTCLVEGTPPTVGERLRIGAAAVEVTAPCPRCVMVDAPQGPSPDRPTGLAAQPGLLRRIARTTGGALGVYARVVAPGEVGVGDRVEPA